MQATHVHSIERTIQKTNEWLKAVQERMGTDDRHHAYVALRATLHALRDRLNPDEALQLGAQLPTLVRGVYYEGWRMIDTPVRVRTLDEFLGVVAVEAGDAAFDSEAAARAVFAVLAERVSAGEIDDVKRNLPRPIRELWDD
jgi:uncharacterized protein (DUF2267 family)